MARTFTKEEAPVAIAMIYYIPLLPAMQVITQKILSYDSVANKIFVVPDGHSFLSILPGSVLV
jgi:hypothetical protein